MEIQTLRFVVTETDLNELVAVFRTETNNIRNLQIAVLPEGIRVSGVYEMLIGVPFEAIWEVSVSEGRIVATLARLKSGMLNLGLAKGYLVRTAAARLNLVEWREDSIILDVDSLLRSRGIPLRTNLKRIRCDYGSLTLES